MRNETMTSSGRYKIVAFSIIFKANIFYHKVKILPQLVSEMNHSKPPYDTFIACLIG